jgi:hypothetical protein
MLHSIRKGSARLVLSKHAVRRSQQRGVGVAVIKALLDAADTEMAVGYGCTALSISRSALAEMHAQGGDHDFIDFLGRHVVVTTHSGEVLTVAKLYSGRRGRPYRRGRR